MAGRQAEAPASRSRRALLFGALLAGCSLPSPAMTPASPTATGVAGVPEAPTRTNATTRPATMIAAGQATSPPPAPAPTRPPGARAGGRVVEGVLALPADLNPLLADDPAGRRLAALLFEGLAAVTPDDLAPRPALAERWEVSSDGLIYRFRLRAGVTWHDGAPVTAHDAVTTYRALAAERGLSVSAANLAGVLETVTAEDAGTLVIRLRQPYAPFLVELATLPLLPATHLSGGPAGLPGSPAATRPVGAGPFALTRRDGDTIVLRRFPGYWAGPALLDEIELRRFADADALVAGLANSVIDLAEADLAWLTAARYERLRLTSGLSIRRYASLAVTFLVFGLGQVRSTPLAEPVVRRALAQALDRPALAAAATLGLGDLPVGTLPPSSWAVTPYLEPSIPFDRARAATMLDAAGWPRGDDGRRRRTDQPLAVVLETNAGNAMRAALQAGIADAWRAAGVEVTARQEPFERFVERVAGRGNFEAALVGFDLGPDPDQSLLWGSRAGRAGYNLNRYSNAQVDRLLVAARATLDRDRRRTLYEEIQRAVLTDLPALPLVCPPGLLVARTRLHGLTPNPADPRHGADRWWVE